MSHTQLTSIVPTTDGETWLDAWAIILKRQSVDTTRITLKYHESYSFLPGTPPLPPTSTGAAIELNKQKMSR